MNDLWKFDGYNWTWISGANITDQNGVYRTKGISSSDNVPGSRNGASSWVGSDNTLWLFGGLGYAATGVQGIIFTTLLLIFHKVV